MVNTGREVQNISLTRPSVKPDRGKVCPAPGTSLRRHFKLAFLALLLSLFVIPEMNGQWLPGFGFRKQITIPEASVYGTGTHTNFPVLIEITDDDLRSISNGGLVISPVGWDIVFSQDHVNPLNFEVESYDPASGRIVAWVQIPNLEALSDNTLYIYFTSPTPVDPSPLAPATWDPAAYVAVYHLQGDDYSDATISGYDGTATGTSNSPGSVIEDGQDFEYGSPLHSDRIEIGSFDVASDSLTITAWINPESFSQRDARIISKADGSGDQDHWWMLSTVEDESDTRLRFRQKAGASEITTTLAASTLAEGNWAYVGAVYDGDSMFLYKDGGLVGGKEHDEGGTISTDNTVDVAIGNQPNTAMGGTRAFDGVLDEVRIQRVARSQFWLHTEFDNQQDPANFYSSLGATEIINDDPCDAITLPVHECYDPDTLTNYAATGSGVQDPGCGVYSGGDVWFKVIIPAGQTKIVVEIDTDVTNQVSGDGWAYQPEHAIYSDACGSLTTPVICSSNNTYLNGLGSRSVLEGLTPGTELLIRVWENSSDDNEAFRIGVFYDETPPSIPDCPSEIIQDIDPGQCTDVVNWVAPTASDNCTPAGDLIWVSSHIPGTSFPIDTSVVVYYAIDLADDTAVCSFNVIIQDDEVPVITHCADTKEVVLDGTSCSVALPDYTSEAEIAITECSTYEITQSPVAGTFISDTTVVTLTVTDEYGNFATCQFTVNTIDDTYPTFTVPPSDTVCRALDCTYNIDPGITGDVTDEWDNCATGIEAYYEDDFANQGNCDSAGFVIRTWILEDEYGNETRQDQIIWINPVSIVIPVVENTILCDSANTHIELTSPNIYSSGAVTFNYTVAATGGVTGFTTPVTGLPVGHVIQDQLFNPTIQEQTVTYTIAPVSPVGCLNGNAQVVIITVNPTPRLTVDVPELVYCDSSTVSFTVNDGITSSTGAQVYSVFRNYNDTDVHIEGEVPGLDDNQVYGVSLDEEIRNLTSQVQTVSYTFRPLIKDPRGNGSLAECNTGKDTTIVISIEPTPDIEVEIGNDTICNEDFIALNVTNPNFPILGNWRYKLEVDYGDSIQGELPELPLYTDYADNELTITDTLKNIGVYWHTVAYRFIPYIESVLGGDSCLNGLDTTIIVWVNPTPAIRVIANDTVICNGATTTIRIRNPNEFVYGAWEYDLIVTDADGMIEGESPDMYGITDSELNESLTNIDTIAHKVEYTFIPTKEYGGLTCNEVNDTTIVIWVNPTPQIRAEASDTEICTGDTVDLGIRNPNVFVMGEWMYDLEISKTSDLLEGAVSGQQVYNGDTTYRYILTNNDIIAHQITFDFHPRIVQVDGGDDCQGGEESDTSITITVYPTPQIRASALDDTLICSGDYVNFTVTNPNSTLFNGYWWFNLEVTADPEIEGANPDSTFLPPHGIPSYFDDILINRDTITHKVEYRFRPRIRPFDGDATCENGRDTLITIYVNPTPAIDVTLPDYLFCNNQVVEITVHDPLGNYILGSKEYEIFTNYDRDEVTVTNVYTGTVRPIYPYKERHGVDHDIRDSISNTSDIWKSVFYRITPYIYDTRPGHENTQLCGPGKDTLIEIYINPTPRITVEIEDSILCDGARVEFSITNEVTTYDSTEVVYGLNIQFDSDSVSGVITPNGEYRQAGVPQIEDWLFNNSDTVQVLDYGFTARIKDNRVGKETHYCDDGNHDMVRVLLNPIPRLRYTLDEDTLCYNDGFVLELDSLVYTTSPLHYNLFVDNSNNLNHVRGSAPGEGIAVADDFGQEGVVNPWMDVRSVGYKILPFISEEGCEGDTSYFEIDVNPEPVMTADLSTPKDTAVCFKQGYNILITTAVISTTGQLLYDLNTFGYNEPLVENERLSGDYIIEHLNQMTVVNTGDSIEEINYRFMPVIRDAKGPGRHCLGDPKEDIIVQVAPELKGNLVADSAAFGGWEIVCNGELSLPVHSNVRGGYYRQPYRFDWSTNGGIEAYLEDRDSAQSDLSVGWYRFEVWDTIGCYFFSDSILIEQPDTIVVEDSITKVFCWNNEFLGSIDVTVDGGTPNYSYQWYVDDILLPEHSNHLDADGNWYDLTVLDANACRYEDAYEIQSVTQINITVDTSKYMGFGITCFGDSTGTIDIGVAGEFPPYDVEVYRFGQHNFEVNQPVATGSVDENENLSMVGFPAGQYVIYAFDTVGCYNPPPAGHPEYIPIVLTEPDSFVIEKDNPFRPGMVDVSCFNADDAEIHLRVNGGRIGVRPGLFEWTGNDEDLVDGDSVQTNLGPGLYQVHVTDAWGCEDSAEFNLIEPSEVILTGAIVSDMNSWNISCFGQNDGFIHIGVEGGIPGYDYAWATTAMTMADSTLEDQSQLVAGRYDLSILDSINCPLDTFFILKQPNPLLVDEDIPLYPGPDGVAIACAYDATGMINLTPYGGADSLQNDYLWTSTGGYLSEPDIMNQSNLPVGTYTLSVTDINGCRFDTFYVLKEPEPMRIVSLTAKDAVCANTATGFVYLESQGGIPGYTYEWSNNETSRNLEMIGAGIYTVIIRDTNLCELIDSIEVSEADNFVVDLDVATDYNGTPISCSGFSDGAITLNPRGGTAPYFFIWNTGDTTRNLVGVPAGFYFASIRDINGCADSVEVEINEPPPLEYDIDPEDPLCYRDSSGRINLLITGGTVFKLDDYRVWLNGTVSEPYMENLPQGEYLIRIEDLNDCYVETQAELIHPPLLTLDFSTREAFCKDKADGQLVLNVDGGTPPYFIEWNRDLPENEQYFYDVYWGEYVATVTDFNHCVSKDSATVGYTYTSCLVIPTAFSPNGDGFNDLWIIEGLELYPNVDMVIFDRWGNKMYQTVNAADEPWDGSFNGRILPIDSYHFVIDLNNDEPALMGNVTILR
ncbi:MAG: DUF2341 domain-containing protein [Bacteroidota bacterium]